MNALVAIVTPGNVPINYLKLLVALLIIGDIFLIWKTGIWANVILVFFPKAVVMIDLLSNTVVSFIFGGRLTSSDFYMQSYSEIVLRGTTCIISLLLMGLGICFILTG